MIMRNKTKFFTVLLAVTIFFSCGNISDKKIRIAYANWAEGIAVTYLAKEILSEQGYRIELLNADIAPIFTSLARGKTDVFMDSWLPVTHADYFRKYNGKLEILGQIYDSARIGLVVPEYVPVHMIEELGGHTGRFSGEIVGIDAYRYHEMHGESHPRIRSGLQAHDLQRSRHDGIAEEGYRQEGMDRCDRMDPALDV